MPSSRAAFASCSRPIAPALIIDYFRAIENSGLLLAFCCQEIKQIKQIKRGADALDRERRTGHNKIKFDERTIGHRKNPFDQVLGVTTKE